MKAQIQASNRRQWNRIQQNKARKTTQEEKKDNVIQVDFGKKGRSLDKS